MTAILMQQLLENQILLLVNFTNLTSGTKLNSGIKINSFSVTDCSLVSESKCGSEGHQVLLQFQVVDSQTKAISHDLEIIGKVSKVNSSEESKNFEVEVQFKQYSKDEWQKILQLFDLRQERMASVIKGLKL